MLLVLTQAAESGGEDVAGMQLKNKNEAMCEVCEDEEETDASLESLSDVSSHHFGRCLLKLCPITIDL